MLVNDRNFEVTTKKIHDTLSLCWREYVERFAKARYEMRSLLSAE
jgi:hypothetical protein